MPIERSNSSVAQEIVSWYFEHLDELQSHSLNVQNIFSGPVIALTASILSSDPVGGDLLKGCGSISASNSSSATRPLEEIESVKCESDDGEKKLPTTSSANTGGKPGHNWRTYLTNGFASTANGVRGEEVFRHQDAARLFESLSLRSQARLAAFLEGVCLAVDAMPVQHQPTAAKTDSVLGNSYTSARGQANNDFDKSMRMSLGLVEGLEGFRELGRNGGELIPNNNLLNSGKNSVTNSASDSFTSTGGGSTSGAAAGQRRPKKRRQMDESELVLRLELYIRTLQRCRHLGRDCVVSAESNRAMKARAQFVVVSFVETVGTVRQQSPVLTRLLTALTKELLAVPILSENLVRAIRRIVSNYVHTTSFASLAFLSSPENAAESRLKPSIIQFLKFLQQNWQSSELDCDMERMLSSAIDPSVRNMFKTAEFQSIGHLLEVCQAFRNDLRNIELPPYNIYDETMNKVDDAKVKQALRDLQREIITVNGQVLPPVRSRSDLVHLLSQTLNSRSVANPAIIAANLRSKKNKKAKTKQKPSSSSVYESETDDESVSGTTDDDTATTSSYTPTAARRRRFRLSTIDHLTKRLLLAAGRTGTGGDAYFVVRDLFGGPDVEVVPSQSNFHNTYYRPLSSSGTIDLIVKLTSVTIKCHASFDVFPKHLVGETEPLIQVHTTTAETIHLQEIRLADLPESARKDVHVPMWPQLYANDSGNDDDDDGDDSNKDSNNNDFYGFDQQLKPSAAAAASIMVVQERKTEKSGYRMLSVRPAVYEMVEVFNTPS